MRASAHPGRARINNMPEEIDKSAAADAGNGAGGDQAGQKPAEQQQGTDAGKSDGASDAGKGAENKDGAAADSGKKDEAAQKPLEPAVKHRTSKDFIIERKDRQLARQAAEKAAKAGQADDAGKDDETDEADVEETDDEENEISEQDEALVAKVVAKRFAPILEKHVEAEDLQEIQGFLKDNPDFAPYEKQVKVFMQHPSRRSLPIKSIFYEVAGDDLLKIGAQRQQEADKKAKETQAGGGTQQGGDTKKKSAWDMTPEEFEAEKLRVRTSTS